MIAYLIHASILLSGLIIFYWLFLKNETFFTLNRWTFMCCILLSFALPSISIPASLSIQKSIPALAFDFSKLEPDESKAAVINEKDIAHISSIQNEEDRKQATTLTAKKWSLKSILLAIYIVGVVIFLIVFLLQLIILLTRKYNLNSVKTGKYTIVELVKDVEPYSFMNTIYINPESYDPETYEQIIAHEKLHIDQAHFVDKLLAEFLVILFWFNPLMWLLRSAIGKNLEFLTDHMLLKKGMEKESYQMSLLKVSVSTKPFNLTTSYNNSFLKNRIIMMNSKKSSIASIWKYLFILPLFFLSMISLNAIQDEALPSDETVQLAQDAIPENPINSASSSVETTNKNWKSLPLTDTANPKNAKRELNLETVTGINIANNANISIRKSDRQKIIVEGPTHLLDALNLEVKNGFWNVKIGKDDDYKSDKSGLISIVMEVKELNNATISGEGSISGQGVFKTSGEMNVSISGSGNIVLDFESSSTNCTVSGSGNIVLKGKTEKVHIGMSGSGNITTTQLLAKDVNMGISGNAKIAVHAERSLNTAVSGVADIEYTGNPKVSSSSSGDATINRRGRN
ncbi:GIN domain-containing protein [Portibacter lacus]|uniref:Peptidase M56 domain-containing protein n=1 Tax=Portibacter lacus TaxID=1099794 RepID=A0AA37WDP3_9BACT|nr:DUF2807 domain-containing protein [Portibacter lacus]GLR17158.1 hypothetical protein GCM10007940_17730 [Portibacter lacus]